MSLKDAFGKKSSILQNATTSSAGIESTDYMITKLDVDKRFEPHVDFTTASNFARFGSAEMYYSASMSRIYNEYPYDGTKREKLIFDLSSSYLDKWVLDNKYPQSTGWINLHPESQGVGSLDANGYGVPDTARNMHIFIKGGMHTRVSRVEMQKNKAHYFNDGIVYDPDKDRVKTFVLDPTRGWTVEFWLKKDAFYAAKTHKEVILDLWNRNATSDSDYGRFTLLLDGQSSTDTFKLTVFSGSGVSAMGASKVVISDDTVTNSSLTSWNHYALTANSSSEGFTTRFYVNGSLNNKVIHNITGSMKEIGGLINGQIGSLIATTISSSAQYSGQLSASLDEFRFWKRRRTSEEIHANWISHVGGGTNEEGHNIDLCVYYKFNEGIVGDTSIDNTVLDYSGRIANGYWHNYYAGLRNTGSAFLSSSFAVKEELDPIIYKQHPSVVSVEDELRKTGRKWDNDNPTQLYDTHIPQWIRDMDDEAHPNYTEDIGEASHLRKLYQIVASYFDTAYAQVGAMTSLKEKRYTFLEYKQLPFARDLLENRGFLTTDLFVNSDIIEKFSKRTLDNTLFDNDLQDIKNAVYTNIYNNLEFILKSKGTEKSIRNLLRCTGVDDEIVKLNIYSDGTTHYFQDNIKFTSVKRKFLDFHLEDNNKCTVVQTSSADGLALYITGTIHHVTLLGGLNQEAHSAFTSEYNIRVPKKVNLFDGGYYYNSLYSGIATMDKPNQKGYVKENEGFEISLVREKLNSKTAKFQFDWDLLGLSLTSSWYQNIYDDNFWTIAVRLKPNEYPYNSLINRTISGYTLEVYGVNHVYGDVENEFLLTSSVTTGRGEQILKNSKRFSLGAKRANWTGSVVYPSDIQISDFRFYLDYLDDSTIRAHNLDSMNYGIKDSSFSISPALHRLSGTIMPARDSLAIHWGFDAVTSSDASGKFIVQDQSSGSLSKYGWADNYVNSLHNAHGFGFTANSTNVVINDYIVDAKKELPEISYTADSVYIKDEERKFLSDKKITKGSFFSLEKSMNQVISQEMLNMFGSVKDFSNLVGNPVDKYRTNYKNLDAARQFFFERVSGSLDFEKFIDYYRWIDSSISHMVNQLYPVSVNSSNNIVDVVDSHILERNKYQNKFPLLTTYTATENAIKGRRELSYNWKYGHAPIGKTENDHCLWQKERAERSDITDRETIRKIIINDNNMSSSVLGKLDGTSYQSNLYHDRRLAQPLVFEKTITRVIHGGINYPEKKNRDFIHNAVHRHGPTTTTGIPRNVLIVGHGSGSGENKQQTCNDVRDPNALKRVHVQATVGRFAGSGVTPSASSDAESYNFRTNESKIPINIISSSVATGYNSQVSSRYRNDVIFTNIHSDTTDFTNEVPMQGPFPEAWVGGHQSRHVEINKYDLTLRDDDNGGVPLNNIDNQYTRPEAWRLLLGDKHASDGAFGFTGFDYGGPYPDPARKGATYYRGLRAKRPLNLQNIKTTTGSKRHGNFMENYELISAVGKNENNLYFRNNPEITNYLPSAIANILPKTTHVMGLYGQAPFVSGNVFGTHHNNRQPDVSSLVVVSGSYATASFTVLRAPYRQRASASFDVKGIIQEPFLDGTKFYIHNSLSGTMNFIIKTGSVPSNSGSNFYVATGSSNTDFWNNLRTSLTNNSGYNTTYSGPHWVGGNRDSIALNVSSSGNSKLALSSSGISDFVTDNFSFSAWVNLSSSFTGSDKYIFRFNRADGSVSRELFISGNGDLYYNAKFFNGGVTHCTKQYRLIGFESLNTGSWTHLAVSHLLPGASFGTVNFWVNNALTSSTNASIPSAPAACTAGGSTAIYDSNGSIFFLNRDISGTNTEFRGSIDEISIWSVALSTNQVNNLYNGGRRAIITNNYLSSSNLLAWYSFEEQDAGKELVSTESIITDYSGRTNHLTTMFNAGEPITAVNTETITNEEYAIFNLTSSDYGDRYNGSLALNASYTSNQNIVMMVPGSTQAPIGGYISGAVAGDQIGIQFHGFEVDPDQNGTGGAQAYGVAWGGGKLHMINTSWNSTNTSFWNMLSQSIKDNTDFDTISIVTSTESASFNLTSRGQNVGYNGYMVRHGGGSSHTFNSLLGPSGGMGHDERIVNDVVIAVPDGLIDGNKNRTIITSRFSAPGGIEVQSKGYLDAYSHEYSVHNALPYRNLTVRASGSGEASTIRLLDHLGNREGLTTHLSRHCGQFGADSNYGSVTADDGYTGKPAFHKTPRNVSRKPTAASTLLSPVLNKDHDNYFIQRPIPQSDFQYSWVTSSIGNDYSVGSGKQRIYGYAPKSGMVSASYYGIVEAIVFPTASSLYGEEK